MSANGVEREDGGLEVIIEPDVVPRGTVDLRAIIGGARADGRPRETHTARGRREAVLAQVAAAHVAPPPALVAAAPVVAAAVAPAVAAEPEPEPAEPEPAEPAPEEGLLAEALPDLPPEPASPTLMALEAAAKAPIPPRPDAALAADAPDPHPEPEAPPVSLGEVSAFSTLAKLLAQLLALLLCLIALYLHLMGLAPWQEQRGAEPAAMAPAAPSGEAPRVDTVPVTPPPAAEPEPSPEPAPEPEPAPPADPAPEPEVEAAAPPAPSAPSLEDLRALLAEAETGAELGVEEDAPGLLARIEGLRARAARLIDRGELDEAAEVLRELIGLAPEDGDAYFRLGYVHHRKGDLDEAAARYRGAAERSPRDPRPLNNLGLIQTGRGERDAAKATYARALDLAPDDPDVLSNLAALLEANAPTQAHPLYEKALERDPRHAPARLGRARVRAAVGDRQGARADYQALVDQGGPHAHRALDGLGVLARIEGDARAAAALHRQALERTPAFAEARVNLGVALLDLGRDDEARKELDDAVKALPRSPRAWQALGVARSRLGMLYEAKEAYEAAIKLDGDDWATRFDYALCAEQFGNILFAMREYERSIALNPTAWQPYANLARLYVRGDQRQKAIELLTRGLEVMPRQPDLTYALAHALALEGRDAEARARLRQFLAVAPASDPRVEVVRRGLGGS
ncbi:MAG: tetratricopeptide repeat protein [Planctomycetes bacterium]|nr:tetratricopeptide repeat protein [Planctomycetota bacterium]